MPDIIIRNETGNVLRMSMIFGTPLYYDNNVEVGGAFIAHVASIVYTFEARQVLEGMNEYSRNDTLVRAGSITGAVLAGTTSVVLGSFWALGSFGPHFFAPGRAALATAGVLMHAAHAGGAAYGTPAQGVVFRKDSILIGFENLTFVMRMVDDQYELVQV